MTVVAVAAAVVVVAAVAAVEEAAAAVEETDKMECCSNDRRLILQWHITSRCNLRCKHCYQVSYQTPELDFHNILGIMKQYSELLSALNRKGHINFTGGEPFLREDFFDLLHECKRYSSLFSFGILTNGTLLNRKTVEELKKLQPDFIQVSIEGNREIHDSIRGSGNLDIVIKGLELLSYYRIKTLVSFTAHRGNYKSFSSVVDLCRKHNVFKVWTDRIVPFGNGEDLKDQVLNPEEAWEFFMGINKLRKQKGFPWKQNTIVEMSRALQFLAAGNTPYRCGAGESLITVLEDGIVLPCRRLPIDCGNIKEKTLLEIYSDNKTMRGLREQRDPPHGCEKCSYFFLCDGGAKCISYAITKDPFSRDPGCPIKW
jgi:radical SAM protein with 4Fe4S-binding SPASM domain